ncbi:MAG TPA: ABC transporter permease [Clostridia bacterium]|nr:ABC transporter permease [Clostridia bacterium]
MIIRHAWHIFCKDLLLEWRSKQTISSMLIFAIMVVVMFAFAFQPTRDITRAVFPGMTWVAFTFAGILGLNRAFLSEKQQDCLTGLILAPMDPTAIYFGKVLGTMFLMGVMELIALPLFFVLFDFRLQGSLALLILVILLGTLGFASVGTLLAALAANSRSSELLLPLILFPIIVPVLISSVKATGLILSGGAGVSEVLVWLRLLGVYDLVFLVVPFLLFEFVLEV